MRPKIPMPLSTCPVLSFSATDAGSSLKKRYWEKFAIKNQLSSFSFTIRPLPGATPRRLPTAWGICAAVNVPNGSVKFGCGWLDQLKDGENCPGSPAIEYEAIAVP